MLDFLKPKVELVELKAEQLVFRSTKKFREGANTSLRVSLPEGSNNTTTVDVKILGKRDHEEGGYVYVSRLQVPPKSEQVVTGSALRSAARKDLSIRVRSPKLPGFSAMTLDVSATGLRIEMGGELSVGEIIPLTLEFDRHDLPPITTPAEVRWCRAGFDDRSRAKAGFMFRPDSLETEKLLQAMGDFFTSAAQADLRTLLGSANMLRDETTHIRRDLPETPPPSEPVPEAKSKQTLALGARDPELERQKATQAPPPEPQPAPAQSQPAYTDIPVNARIRAYAFEIEEETLVVMLQSGDDIQGLAFPDCRTCRDYRCVDGGEITILRVRLESPLLKETRRDWDVGQRFHYQFLDDREQVVQEIISGACLPA